MSDAVQQGVSKTDKRLTSQFFLIAGLFSDHHQWRSMRTRTRNGLRRRLPQRAASALIEALRLLVRTNANGQGSHGCISRQRCALAPA
ncbi:hypothetical protein [Caballeronia sp.]|uniref:hypothetical protein n=1 Tax=Caballeronia sp. TaxID=1931223 RepID=UPI003C701CA8